MFARIISGPLLIFTAACAAQQSGRADDPIRSPTALGTASALSANTARPDDAQLRATYRCVVEAIVNAGYPITQNEQNLVAGGQIRDDIGDQTVIDGMSARVMIDAPSGRLRVDASSHTDIKHSARSQFVRQGASPRGTSAVKSALACVNPTQSTA